MWTFVKISSFVFTISVTKGQVHESVMHIQDKGSVLTWDFDVLHHDIIFTVYRLPKVLQTTATTGNQVNNVNSATHLNVKNSMSIATATTTTGTAQPG